MQISEKTIDYFKDIITGDSGKTKYLTGPSLIDFFNTFGFKETYQAGFPSRRRFCKEKLIELNKMNMIEKVIENYYNPINFLGKGEQKNYEELIEELNQYLSFDDLTLEKGDKDVKMIDNQSNNDNKIIIDKIQHIDQDFIKEQLKKCTQKFTNKDYDGAITNARSLLESVFSDIYFKITGYNITSNGDLIKDYNKIKPLLNLQEQSQTNDPFKKITSALTTIIYSIAEISNTMSDRHNREKKPEKHHAKIIINITSTLIDFLFDILEFQKNNIEKICNKIITLKKRIYNKNSDQNNFSLLQRNKLTQENDIIELLSFDIYTKRLVINRFIDNFNIKCFDDADKFFLIVVLYFDIINQKDIDNIFYKTNKDYQAYDKLVQFIEDVYIFNKSLISAKIESETYKDGNFKINK